MKALAFAFGIALILGATTKVVKACCDPNFQSCVPDAPLCRAIEWQGPIECNWLCRNVIPWLRWIQEL